MLQDTEILPILTLIDDTLPTKINKQQSPGLPNQQLHMEEIEIILFTIGPILFVKFIKILVLRSTPRIKGPMPPDTTKNHISTLDQGQDPGGHHLPPHQEQGQQDPLWVVLYFDLRLSKIPSMDLTIKKFLPLKLLNPYRLRFQLQKKVKWLIGEEDDQDDQDELMQIPKPRSMDEDWKISVQKAFDDVSRTKAPCEISVDMAVTLPHTISKKQYNMFLDALREHNKKAPQIVLDNMTSIFAKSGKLDIKQANGSYSFEVQSMQCYGLFVPTNFKGRPPFDGNDSNVYNIIHGTTNKGASILAEELIRPGDFTIHRDLAQCGYPSCGFILQVKWQQKLSDSHQTLRNYRERF